MADLVRFRLLSDGARAVLRSDSVRADLERRAIRVAQAARGRAPGVFSRASGGIVADSYTGSGRAGATVIGVPIDYEQENRTLGGAIDAARG